MSGLAAARRWLYATLGPVVSAAGLTWRPTTGTTNPRLFHGVAPAGVAYPLVIFQALSPGNDAQTLTGNHIWSDPLYLIRVITEGTRTDTIEPLVDAIAAVLQGASGTVSGGVVVECRREREHDQPLPPVNGQPYTALGAEWRFKVQET